MKNKLQYQNLLYVPDIICSKVSNCYHNNPLVRYFKIKKTRDLVAKKHFWLIFRNNVEAYVKVCNICLASKTVHHKQYGDLYFFPILTYRLKDIFIDFVIGLLLLLNWKDNSYNTILVIIDWLMKMIKYKAIKITIDILGLAEEIINIVVK